MKSKSYCGNLFCNRGNRKEKCIVCHLFVCTVCSLHIENNCYCIDCGIEKIISISENKIEKTKNSLFDVLIDKQKKILNNEKVIS